MPNFTTDDLLLYLYHELPKQETSLLEETLPHDWALQQKLKILKEAINVLDNLEEKSPRSKTVEGLLHYVAEHYAIALKNNELNNEGSL